VTEILLDRGIKIACENNYVIYMLVLSSDSDVKLQICPK